VLQVVEYRPSKHKALSSKWQHHQKKKEKIKVAINEMKIGKH
jgi:hypothetical protein